MKHYTQSQINYKINGQPESIKYWSGLPMAIDLAVVVIFRIYFGAVYQKARAKAEDLVAEHGTGKFKGIEFSDISFNTLNRIEAKKKHDFFNNEVTKQIKRYTIKHDKHFCN